MNTAPEYKSVKKFYNIGPRRKLSVSMLEGRDTMSDGDSSSGQFVFKHVSLVKVAMNNGRASMGQNILDTCAGKQLS